MINVIQYFFYCLYWFFDNFTVLCSCKLITWQTKPIYKVAQYCKFLAILQNMLISSRNLLRFHHSEIKLRLSMRESHIERENQESVHKINEIKQRKNILWIHLFKLTCDIIPAIELSDVLLIWTKYRIPEVWIGVAGLISALLTTYYPRLDKNYWQKSLKIVQGNLKTN